MKKTGKIRALKKIWEEGRRERDLGTLGGRHRGNWGISVDDGLDMG